MTKSEKISTASLEAINKFLQEPLRPHHFTQPRRVPQFNKDEAASYEKFLVRRKEIRKHLPYENQNFMDPSVARNRNAYYRPLSHADAWVLRRVKARRLFEEEE
jgi:hypothetical protein